MPYTKTNWVAGDTVTSTKLNKIENQLESLSNNTSNILDVWYEPYSENVGTEEEPYWQDGVNVFNKNPYLDYDNNLEEPIMDSTATELTFSQVKSAYMLGKIIIIHRAFIPNNPYPSANNPTFMASYLNPYDNNVTQMFAGAYTYYHPRDYLLYTTKIALVAYDGIWSHVLEG